MKGWVACVGLDPARYGTHSLRRTKATLIYKRTKNIRAILKSSKALCDTSGLRSTTLWRSPSRSRSRLPSIRTDRNRRSSSACNTVRAYSIIGPCKKSRLRFGLQHALTSYSSGGEPWDPAQLEELARDLWMQEHFRLMSPSDAAALWLEPVVAAGSAKAPHAE